MTTMTGGEVIATMLKKEGVEKVFGIIDGTYFGLYSKTIFVGAVLEGFFFRLKYSE